MTPQQLPLRGLMDGEQISQWPAYGWWLLLTLILLCLVGLTVYIVKKRKISLAKRQALIQLGNIDSDQENWPHQTNGLLKRLAISYCAQQDVANLHSQEWVDFLKQQIPERKRQGFVPVIESLQEALYHPKSDNLDFNETILQAKIWISHLNPATIGKEAGNV